MKTYIAGPMTGRPGMNFAAFHAMAALLRAAGHEVVNPAEINPDPAADWQSCMLTDLKALGTCEAIVLLEGWESSPGAQIERLWALRLGIVTLTEAQASSWLTDDAVIDMHLDAVLRASGSALRHYTMQKSVDDMRWAMRAALCTELQP